MANPAKNKIEARLMIKAASRCYVQVWFGTSEQWVRITKADAYDLVKQSWCTERYVRNANDGTSDVLLS